MAKLILEISLSHRQNNAVRKIEATDFLIGQGFSCTEISYTELKSLMKVNVYTHSKKSAAQVQSQGGYLEQRGWKIQCKQLEDCDWLTKWQEDFQITPIGKNFTIVPQWKAAEFKGSRKPIYLDPEAAFGSGRHATTRLVLKVMETFEGKFESFIDMGMGTGVLMIAAHGLGAAVIDGFDWDAGSVKTARLNLKLNQIKHAKVKRRNLFTYKPARQYDLVLANMISKTLCEGQKNICAAVKPGGYLITGGIMIRNLPGYLKAFKPAGLKCLKIIRGKSWAVCLYKKKI